MNKKFLKIILLIITFMFVSAFSILLANPLDDDTGDTGGPEHKEDGVDRVDDGNYGIHGHRNEI